MKRKLRESEMEFLDENAESLEDAVSIIVRLRDKDG